MMPRKFKSDNVKFYRLPRQLPYLWIESTNDYHSPVEATVAEWRQAKRSARQGELKGAVEPGNYVRIVRRMVQLADTFGFADDTPLLPRLRALASTNVLSIGGNSR